MNENVSAFELGDLFDPEGILPTQMQGRLVGGVLSIDIASGERALALAVLEDGIRDWQKGKGSQDMLWRNLAEDARAWMLAYDEDFLYSFERLCRIFDLDAEAVREAVGVYVQWHRVAA